MAWSSSIILSRFAAAVAASLSCAGDSGVVIGLVQLSSMLVGGGRGMAIFMTVFVFLLGARFLVGPGAGSMQA